MQQAFSVLASTSGLIFSLFCDLRWVNKITMHAEKLLLMMLLKWDWLNDVDQRDSFPRWPEERTETFKRDTLLAFRCEPILLLMKNTLTYLLTYSLSKWHTFLKLSRSSCPHYTSTDRPFSAAGSISTTVVAAARESEPTELRHIISTHVSTVRQYVYRHSVWQREARLSCLSIQ